MSSPNYPPSDPPRRPSDPARRYNGPRDDVRMTVPDWDDPEEAPLTLAPPDPEVPAARQAAAVPRLEPSRSNHDRAADRWQFTIGQVLIANSVLAVILAVSHWLAPSLVAGALGLLAFGLFTFVTVYQPQQPGIYSLAWMLIVIYLLAASVALVWG